MIYLRSFKLSDEIERNPNIYPDHVFKHIAGEVLLFDRITVLYGNNGSGKSTLLKVISISISSCLNESEQSETFIRFAFFVPICVNVFTN
ncbi:AAA family ATPase [Paenibacillus borealis]|uniref:ATPase AAA-type core domain-containing protein n=1 Tax=Paenibacillus borealis TaxID=160799 RepID=A0A089LB79_PAEBO|nr:AAA family ATPase [Paenibacillus borealis]AIQ58756.1 hypothetical protein PBOR_18805 [Paenibacillus borealis]